MGLVQFTVIDDFLVTRGYLRIGSAHICRMCERYATGGDLCVSHNTQANAFKELTEVFGLEYVENNILDSYIFEMLTRRRRHVLLDEQEITQNNYNVAKERPYKHGGRIPLNEYEQKISKKKKRVRKVKPRKCEVRIPLNRYEPETTKNNNSANNEQPRKCEVRIPLNRYEPEIPKDNNSVTNEQPNKCKVRVPSNRYEQKIPKKNNRVRKEQPKKSEERISLNRYVPELPKKNNRVRKEQPQKCEVPIPLNSCEQEIPKKSFNDQPYKCGECNQIVWIEEKIGHHSRYHPNIPLDVNIFHEDPEVNQ